MKIQINGYEVEIKAKWENAKRFNKADTMLVLNLISIYAAEAAARYETLGTDTLQRMARQVQDNIYATLEANGYYN